MGLPDAEAWSKNHKEGQLKATTNIMVVHVHCKHTLFARTPISCSAFWANARVSLNAEFQKKKNHENDQVLQLAHARSKPKYEFASIGN